mgnify:CR=1 FL=1
MLFLGTQLSSGKGFKNMGLEALAIEANTFQFFLRNPRGTKAKTVDPADVGQLKQILAENNFGPIIAHAPYTLNACSKDPHLRELSAEMFADDLERMENLPGNLYNLHPGSSLGQPLKEAVNYIAAMLNGVMNRRHHTTILLETMSGKGSEVGQSFEELAEIIARVDLDGQIGVCFDACHLWDSGYDIVNDLDGQIGVCFDACHLWDSGYDIVNDLDGVLNTFDKIIGLEKLKAFHLNNSRNPLGSRKDRHAPIGEGFIGLEGVFAIISHPQLKHLPFVTETPLDLAGHQREIALLKSRLID